MYTIGDSLIKWIKSVSDKNITCVSHLWILDFTEIYKIKYV